MRSRLLFDLYFGFPAKYRDVPWVERADRIHQGLGDKPVSRLTQHDIGVYRWTRHPICVAFDLLFVETFLVLSRVIFLPLALVWIPLLLCLMLRENDGAASPCRCHRGRRCSSSKATPTAAISDSRLRGNDGRGGTVRENADDGASGRALPSQLSVSGIQSRPWSPIRRPPNALLPIRNPSCCPSRCWKSASIFQTVSASMTLQVLRYF